jgi:hypothetical protein
MTNIIFDRIASGKQFALYLLILFLIVLKIGMIIISKINNKLIIPSKVEFAVI